jgi:hypothetical protein
MSNIATQLERPAQDLERYLPAPNNDARFDAPERAKPRQKVYTKSYEHARDADRPGRSGTIPHDGEYTIAYEKFDGESWTVKDLAGVLSLEPETAAKRRREWQGAGLISNEGLSNGRYRFLDITEG